MPFISDEEDCIPLESRISEFHYSASRKMYVGNLPKGITKEKLEELFSPYGPILNVRDVDKKSHTYIEYTDIKSVVKAIEAMDGEDCEDKKLSVNFGRQVIPSDCLWIDHVTVAAKEEDILDFCAQRPGKPLPPSLGLINRMS